MKKLLFLFPILLLADIDPFKAGLASSNPYGLTPQEKAILKNKKQIQENKLFIKKLSNSINTLKSQLTQKFVQYDESISDLNNKFSSFDTILSEIDLAKIELGNIKKRLKEANLTNIKQKIEILEHKIIKLEEQNNAKKNIIAEITTIQNENFQNLSNSIKEILQQIKKLNSNVSLSPNQIFNKAKQYFFNGKLSKAKELFLYSLNRMYLPATSSYYLGEIEYKQNRFKEALAYYKKSISLYNKKASFTDKLLYHTAISFLKLKQIKKAKLTFQKLINDFPNSKYARFANKELEKLK